APSGGARLTGAGDIRGTVGGGNLDSWVLEQAPLGSDAFTLLASGHTPVTGGTLALFDPAAVADGFYRLRLTAVNLTGASAVAEVTVEAHTSAKPAEYRRAETDLSATLGGVTFDVVREYDSLAAGRPGTFGFGWRLANR